MSKFGRVQRVTVDGITYRSKAEYHYKVYLDVLKRGGEILDWVYEDPEFYLKFKHGPHGNKKGYLPDFAVQELDESWSVHEYKGFFSAIDAAKIRAFVEKYDNKFILVFGCLRNTKSHRALYNRAKRLEPHIEATGGHIIWEAKRDLFKPIEGMFEY